MRTVDEALRLVLDRTPAGNATERLAVPIALGAVLSVPVVAEDDLPPFARSTMDGFAVRSIDAQSPGARLNVTGESAAGRPFLRSVGRGEAARIFTGAAIPDGADAVVMMERTRKSAGAVELEDAVRPGENIAGQGEDVRRGETVIEAGTPLSHGHVALLASLGVGHVTVVRRPRVAILATGTELVAQNSPRGAAQIRESNSLMLGALLTRAGAEVIQLGIVHDDKHAIEARARRGLEHDVLLMTGGSSVGDYDFTPDILAQLGVQVHFDRVALKPGKPTLFGTRDERVVFGLPGNPVSAFVTFHLFVWPALRRRGGRADASVPRLAASLERRVTKVHNRDQWLPATLALDGGIPVARFTGWNGSGDVRCIARANALLGIPSGEGDVDAGSTVPVLPIVGAELNARAR